MRDRINELKYIINNSLEELHDIYNDPDTEIFDMKIILDYALLLDITDWVETLSSWTFPSYKIG